MELRLRYFEGCPHWQAMRYRLGDALRAEGMANVEPILERAECRVYSTPEGLARVPTPEQLRAALRAA